MTSRDCLQWTKSLSSGDAWENHRLVEFAVWLSSRSTALVSQLDAVPKARLQDYWQAARFRWRGWMRSLKHYHAVADYADSAEWEPLWKHTGGVAAEVLATEPVARVWGALLATGESLHQWSGSDAVTRSVLSNHMAAVDYVMNLLDRGPRVPEDEAAQLKHLHHHSRRWCDLVVAPLIGHGAAKTFAVDPQRSAEFYASYFTSDTRPEVFWGLFNTSVQLFFRRYSLATAPSGDANREVIRSILESLPSEAHRTDPAEVTLGPHALCGIPRDRPGRLDGLP